MDRLTPVFEIRGERLVFAPSLAGTVTVRELGPPIATLVADRDRIIATIDALPTGA